MPPNLHPLVDSAHSKRENLGFGSLPWASPDPAGVPPGRSIAFRYPSRITYRLPVMMVSNRAAANHPANANPPNTKPRTIESNTTHTRQAAANTTIIRVGGNKTFNGN